MTAALVVQCQVLQATLQSVRAGRADRADRPDPDNQGDRPTVRVAKPLGAQPGGDPRPPAGP